MRGGEWGGGGEGDVSGRAPDIFEDELSGGGVGGGGGGEEEGLGEGLEDGAYGWSGDRDGEGKALRFGKDYGVESGEICGGGLDGNAEGLGRGNDDLGWKA